MEARPSPATAPAATSPAVPDNGGATPSASAQSGDFDALLALLLTLDGTAAEAGEAAPEAGDAATGEPGKPETAGGRSLPFPASTNSSPRISHVEVADGQPLPPPSAARPLSANDVPQNAALPPGVSAASNAQADPAPPVPPSAVPEAGEARDVLPVPGPEFPRARAPDERQVQGEAALEAGEMAQTEHPPEAARTDAPARVAPEGLAQVASTPRGDDRGPLPASATSKVGEGRPAVQADGSQGEVDGHPGEDAGQGDPSRDPGSRQESARLAVRFQQIQERLAAMVPGPRADTSAEATDPMADPALDPLQDLNRELLHGNETRPLRLNLSTPVPDPRWGRDFSERILWLTRNDQSSAELRLNPRHLGPIQVRIQLDDDQATLHIQAHQAATREAVEAALPRLRESLAEAGIQLAQAHVGGQGASTGDSGGAPPDQGRPTVRHGSDGPPEGADSGASPPPPVLASDGLLDTFI